MKFLIRLKSQLGQGTVEYALIVAAIVIVITAVLFGANAPFRQAISDAFTRATTAINAAT